MNKHYLICFQHEVLWKKAVCRWPSVRDYRKPKFCRSSFRIKMDFLVFFFFLGPHLWHVKFCRLGVKLELSLTAYATVSWDPSHVCDLYHSSWRHQILNLPSKARDWTHILMDARQVCNPMSCDGNSWAMDFFFSQRMEKMYRVLSINKAIVYLLYLEFFKKISICLQLHNIILNIYSKDCKN